MHPIQTPPLARPEAGTTLASRYERIRAASLELARPLSEADCQVQSMPDASPVKWHLAHITWFFETFLLERFEPGFMPHHGSFRVLYNSYYNGIGQQHPRAQRGLVTRPSLAEVCAYRAAVDERVLLLLQHATGEMAKIVELGLQHEQQHQELLLTDVLHLLSCNPLEPVYRQRWPLAAVAPSLPGWTTFEGGTVEIGHDGNGFAFDNEGPRHRHFLRPYALANRLVTHGEWADFIEDGGYQEPRWWLASGWDWARANGIAAPLYWRREAPGADWRVFTLHGAVPIDPHTPVTHISLYEADAYARWCSAQQALVQAEPLRLPTEFEWEHAAAPLFESGVATGHFVESDALHPVPASRAGGGLLQLFGDVWEWTSSNYGPYPGFKAWDGAVGEYNAKFMVNQMVLRGGSCATPRSHIRASYRNFFPADARWQFNGLRLARDVG